MACALLAGCDSGPQANQQSEPATLKVLKVYDSQDRVSSTSYKLKGEPEVSIAFGNDKKSFELTFLRHNLRQGYHIRSQAASRFRPIILDARQGSKVFVESLKENTFVDLTVEKIDDKTQTATLLVKGRLVDSSTFVKFLEVETRLVFTGEHYTQLTKGAK
jgi:hypothetical protein